MFHQPTARDTFELRPLGEDEHPHRPRVCWTAPGSMRVERLAAVWESSGSLADLVAVPGPWAAVLWSPATASHVVLSDPVGTLPVFIATTRSGGKVAGSWLAALADRDDVDDAPDPEGILVTLSTQFRSDLTTHKTRLANVRAVPWGRAAFVDRAGTVRVEQYWTPERVAPLGDMSAHEAARLLDEAIGAAIDDLVPPPGTRVAAHISSGLDCTTIALRVHEVLRARGEAVVRGYSWSPDEREVPRMPGDERELLDEVERVSGIPIWKRYSDESGDWLPLLDPTRYPDSTLARERFVLPHAAADGVSVMFSGWGGDELSSFNGRRVTPTLLRSGKWGEALRQGRARQRVLEGSSVGSLSTARRYARVALLAMPPGVQQWRHPVDAVKGGRERRRLEHRIREFSPLAADAFVDNRRYQSVMSFRELQLNLFRGGHMQGRTRSWYQVGRLFGLDYRYPLLDIRVVELALGLPWQAFYSDGWDRTAFRLMAADHVPASVAWNVTKIEPAHFYPKEIRLPERSKPEPEVQFPDTPGVVEAKAIAASLQLRASGRQPATGVVAKDRLKPPSGGVTSEVNRQRVRCP